ncbi:hypothetical protein [Amycolatopsis sp. WAC 01416]|uniref:hypothetical protein n=1 Tax=Amycolatopsis sp. WAC 01416 TaxID=2203196 RepID=UPI000F7B1DDC|nr:hypothetical protein [Amycolatopsis sp. WAC 01416]
MDDDFQTYVSQTEYTRYREPQRLHLGGSSSTATNGKRAWLSFYYDINARQSDRTIVDAEVLQPMQTDTRYSYNPAGNITSISSASPKPGHPPTCIEWLDARDRHRAWCTFMCKSGVAWPRSRLGRWPKQRKVLVK